LLRTEVSIYIGLFSLFVSCQTRSVTVMEAHDVTYTPVARQHATAMEAHDVTYAPVARQHATVMEAHDVTYTPVAGPCSVSKQ
jgi:hypothetical protein